MIRILVLERTPLQGDVISTALANQPDFEVIGCVTEEAAAGRRAGDAHVILTSAFLPDQGARRAISSIVRRHFDARVVVIDVPRTPAIAMDYLEAGARGYVYQGESVAALVDQIRAVARGHMVVDPAVAGSLAERIKTLARLCEENEIDVGRLSALTAREMDVLRLVERGASNKEIGRQLGIEVGTVKNHVHNLLRKLKVSSREEAALYLRLLERNGG